MTTVAELLIEGLAEHGVRSVWGVVGDALNPVTDAIRREDRIEWIGLRHEEAVPFAAGAQPHPVPPPPKHLGRERPEAPRSGPIRVTDAADEAGAAPTQAPRRPS